MTVRQKLYFIGWEYNSADALPFKRALMDPAFPWEAVAVVHDQVLVDAVDGIALMTTADFLQHCTLQPTTALLFSTDSQQCSLWRRRGRDYGIRWVDQGELLLEYAKVLSETGQTRDLGPVHLPCAFDAQALQVLKVYQGRWSDRLSNQTFDAYLSFLETGLMTRLGEVMQPVCEHPFYQPAGQRLVTLSSSDQALLVWEIASARSAFLEQAILQNCDPSVRYAFSSLDACQARAEAVRLGLLLEGLGISPAVSCLSIADGRLSQEPIAGFALPDAGMARKWLRLDVADPARVLAVLGRGCTDLLAWVRLGQRPEQLLQLLASQPLASMTLSCDRPGPLGLQVCLDSRRPDIGSYAR